MPKKEVKEFKWNLKKKQTTKDLSSEIQPQHN